MLRTDSERSSSMNEYDKIPDVRTGSRAKSASCSTSCMRPRRSGAAGTCRPTMLWGRVCEHFYISPEDLSLMLARLGARKYKSAVTLKRPRGRRGP